MNQACTDQKAGFFQLQPRFARRDVWDRIAQEEGLYFEVLELSGPPVLNENGRLRDYIEWYQDRGRVKSLHGCFIDVNPASGDQEFARLSRRRYRESCALAAALGAENVVFHSTCEPFLRGAYLDIWAGKTAEFYAELAQEFSGLHLFMENSMDVDPGPIREVMRRAGNARIGVCLDIGHANYSRQPLEKWFDELGEWIGYMHLSDNNGLFDDHIPLGTGCVDVEKAHRLWLGLKRDIPITLEDDSPENLTESLAFLRKHRFFHR